MAVRPPPIQEKTANNIGVFPQVWVAWLQSVANELNDTIIRLDGRTTWFDNADLATQTTPISHTGGASNTYLTNDTLGTFTSEYNPDGLNNIWDASANAFDFSNLKFGDVVFIRFDLEVTTSTPNEEFDIIVDCAIGSASAYSLYIHHVYYKTASSYKVNFVTEIYMGNDDTLQNPCKLRFESVDNATIKVNGWYTRVNLV
jgi:hypothetical protein